MSTPVFELLAEDIRTLRIDTAFGLMSDDTAVLINALEALGIRFVAARHENTAVAMAEGYAAATGRLGMAVIGRGPAAANAINAAVHATRTGSRVLLIYGDEPRTTIVNGPGPDIKKFDVVNVLSQAGLEVFRPVNVASLRGSFIGALDSANQGKVAALVLPKDLLEERVARPVDAFAYQPRRQVFVPSGRGSQDVDIAAHLIGRCQRPLIIAGWGAVQAEARQAIEALGEKIGAVYATTLRASGYFHGNAFDLGVIGSFSHSVARRFIEHADCVIVFGASLNLFTLSAGQALPPNVPIIHVDADRSHIGRYWYSDVGLVGDASAVAAALADKCSEASTPALRTDENRSLLANFDASLDFTPANTQRTVDPRGAAVLLDKMLPRDKNVVLDVGNFFQIAQFITVASPKKLKYTAEFGSIGLGFGTALGFCAASPGVPTVLFTGDGSLLMTLGELSTCVSEELPLIIVVMNDACLGAERHYLELREMSVAKTMLPMIDFADVATAFGFETATVTTMDELAALRPMLEERAAPILIDIKINPAVPAGFMAEFASKR